MLCSGNVKSIPKEETFGVLLSLRMNSLASTPESLLGKFEGGMMWDCCSHLRVLVSEPPMLCLFDIAMVPHCLQNRFSLVHVGRLRARFISWVY